jgi:hypothetical protein
MGGKKFTLAIGLCLVLTGTTVEAVRSGVAPVAQINVPNINPDMERRLAQVRWRETQERLRRENIEDAQKILLLANELKQYASVDEPGQLSPDAVSKAKEVEKLAKRVNYRWRASTLRIRMH